MELGFIGCGFDALHLTRIAGAAIASAEWVSP